MDKCSEDKINELLSRRVIVMEDSRGYGIFEITGDEYRNWEKLRSQLTESEVTEYYRRVSCLNAWS